MAPEKNTSGEVLPPASHRAVFLRVKWSPLKPPEPASWPTQQHSTIEIKTNFMIVVQIIKSLAGFPSKMKAHLFSKVYNLVVNVSYGTKHPRLGFCLEHITALLEKNGLRVVLLHPFTSAWRGSNWPDLASLLVVQQLKSAGRNQRWGRRKRWAWPGCIHSQVLVHLWIGLAHRWPPLRPVLVLLRREEPGRALRIQLPVRNFLGFSFRFLCPYFIYLFKNHPKKIRPAMTNIWIKAKPDSFQGSWADHTYLGPEFGPWC